MRRLVIAATLLCLLAPAVARADSGVQKLLKDACNDEHIDGHYTQQQYKKALDQLPTDADEYSACRQVIENARLAALTSSGSSHKGGSGGGGGGTTGTTGGGGNAGGGSSTGSTSGSGAAADPLASASPDERNAIAQAGKSAKPVQVGGKLVQPGDLGLGSLTSSDHGLPNTLIALVAVLAAGALGAGGWWFWRRVVARRFG
jgi:hypothetical protein